MSAYNRIIKCAQRAVRKYSDEVTIYSYSAGSYVDGRWVPGTETDETIYANVQPTEGEDLNRVPEGRRNLETISIWTDSVLANVNVVTKEQPTQISWNGKRYEIDYLKNWGGIYHAIATRVTP